MKTLSRWTIARRIVQVGVFLFFLSPLLLSGWALFGATIGGDDPLPTPYELPFYGTLSSSSLLGINILDPFGALQVVAASKTFSFDLLLFALPVLIVYGLIRGRVFCGWICPVNLLLEGVDFLRKKLGITVKEMPLPRHTKIGVAVGVLLITAVIGVPLFEVISPISFINKGIIIGSTAGLVTFAAIVIVELFWGHRVWCRSLCPLGGFYEVLGRVGVMNVHCDEGACIHCDKCKETCLVDPGILDPVLSGEKAVVIAGDCMLCGKCVDICPTKALTIKPGRTGAAIQERTAAEHSAAR